MDLIQMRKQNFIQWKMNAKRMSREEIHGLRNRVFIISFILIWLRKSSMELMYREQQFTCFMQQRWVKNTKRDIVLISKIRISEDILAFENKEVEVIPITEVMKKDSVVMYKGIRYRGYVYINPSKMKVIRTSYSEDGISVDNVYYDNVIHICVYEGRQMLYGKDITKKMFAGIFPTETLNQMILADMNFMGVNNKGYQYQATLCVPESSVYSLANITIGFDNQMSIKKAE